MLHIMCLMDAKERIKSLSEELSRHQYLYYVRAEPVISDNQYDRLFDELLDLEKRFPEFRLPDSPSLRVGSDLDQTFPQKAHKIPVLSLDKVNSSEQLQTWIQKIRAQHPDAELIMEDKIDGLTIVLHYDRGLLLSALTRGDGEQGNDITDNVRTIRQIPLGVAHPDPFIVRGEVYLEKRDFELLNREQAQRFSNPRNLAAGSIRLNHSAQVAHIPLKFAAHDAHFPLENNQTHLDNLQLLYRMGFPLIQPIWFASHLGRTPKKSLPHLQPLHFQEIDSVLEACHRDRSQKAYEIDGLVFKVNQHQFRSSLGMTSHHPRWAIAFKFDAPSAETRLLSIEVQVGRNGRITPVANLEPVAISGSIVSRATLHNQLTIETLNIGPGDLVSVSKRGDVIPAVDEVIKKSPLDPGIFTMPPNCPVCHSLLKLSGAHHFCPNRECPERKQKQIIFFAAKSQMNIVGMGEKIIRQLFALGFVRDIVDLYRFDASQLLGLPGFAEKKIRNIRESIENSKKRPFSAQLSALGIEGLGPQSVRLLMEAGFASLDSIVAAASTDNGAAFAAIPGFGPASAQALSLYFTDPLNLKIIASLGELGLPMEEKTVPPPRSQGPLQGQIWVITGSFQSFVPREKAAELIVSLGGEVSASVSSRTTHLLVGEQPGSKLEKARKTGATIVDEQTFKNMVGMAARQG